MNSGVDNPATSLADLRRQLATRLEQGRAQHFGNVSAGWVEYAEDYFWDEKHQVPRISDLQRHGFMPGSAKVLDLAGGCGQFLQCASDAGYDCWAVEPEQWKLEFVRQKARLIGPDTSWAGKMKEGVGEALPFEDNFFECVTSYQTLEHVDNPDMVLEEMLRVTKMGGGVHIRCPDYRSTYEAHYQLPWLPLFPRSIAKIFLKLLGRPTKGLDTIQYVTKRSIIRSLTRIERAKKLRLSVLDDDRLAFSNALRRFGLPGLPGMYELWATWRYVQSLFRAEASVNLFVRIVRK
jgi:ubiquinone/menaquinone biosynthesis C-methylase UbiE